MCNVDISDTHETMGTSLIADTTGHTLVKLQNHTPSMPDYRAITHF
jgi:hypothetical protein